MVILISPCFSLWEITAVAAVVLVNSISLCDFLNFVFFYHYMIIWFLLKLLLIQIEYPEIEDLAKPRHRFMSSYEQVEFSFIDLHLLLSFFLCVMKSKLWIYLLYTRPCFNFSLGHIFMYRGCNHLIKDTSVACLQLNLMKQFLSR
jgi:hypothetical protein